MTNKKTRNKLGRNFNKKRENDKISKNKRSQVMSKIRSKDTKFEKDFIKILEKYTDEDFERNVTGIRGKPDIVFRRKNICVFLDSDFWHGWQFPRWKHLLKNNFWRAKIHNNRIRDKNTTQYLRRNGWVVIRIWGHEIRENSQKQINIVLNALEKRRLSNQ